MRASTTPQEKARQDSATLRYYARELMNVTKEKGKPVDLVTGPKDVYFVFDTKTEMRRFLTYAITSYGFLAWELAQNYTFPTIRASIRPIN